MTEVIQNRFGLQSSNKSPECRTKSTFFDRAICMISSNVTNASR